MYFYYSLEEEEEETYRSLNGEFLFTLKFYIHITTHTHTQGACRHANVKRWWSDGRLRCGVLEVVKGLAQGHLASAQKVNWHPPNHQSPLTYSGDRFDLEIKS